MTEFIRSRWASHVARMEEGTGVFKILTGKLYWKKALRKADGKTILGLTLKR